MPELELDGKAVQPKPKQLELDRPLASDGGISVTVTVVGPQVPL